jgi:hypothetical protein
MYLISKCSSYGQWYPLSEKINEKRKTPLTQIAQRSFSIKIKCYGFLRIKA